MTSQVLHEMDVVFPGGRLPCDGVESDDGTPQTVGIRGPDSKLQTHRQAAQHRSGRLRTIEALRRPRA